jgi:hypothetical protein
LRQEKGGGLKVPEKGTVSAVSKMNEEEGLLL